MQHKDFFLPTLLAGALLVSYAGSVTAQRARTISGEPQKQTSAQGVVTPTPPTAPSTVKVKYEGGVIGYRKSDGTLSFDDENRRLIFRDKTGKEMFSVPYNAVMVASADTQSRRPVAGTVIASTVPYGLGLPALLFKKKHRYLNLQYRDPDTSAEGLASFKLGDKDLLASVLYTLAQKAGLTQRGEAFIRRRDQS
ncbi:MAG TPA: hypothetical protein VM943_11865 [Pyrinomonadaceae bacterium]|nr:hypothetical protein [Pyrinomonadaceae bacterium]